MELRTVSVLAACIGLAASLALVEAHTLAATKEPKPQQYKLTQVYVPDTPVSGPNSVLFVYALTGPGISSPKQAPLIYSRVGSAEMEKEFATLPPGSRIEFSQLGCSPTGPNLATREQIDSLAAFCKQHQLTLDVDPTD